jgi:hypothetical protein
MVGVHACVRATAGCAPRCVCPPMHHHARPGTNTPCAHSMSLPPAPHVAHPLLAARHCLMRDAPRPSPRAWLVTTHRTRAERVRRGACRRLTRLASSSCSPQIAMSVVVSSGVGERRSVSLGSLVAQATQATLGEGCRCTVMLYGAGAGQRWPASRGESRGVAGSRGESAAPPAPPTPP